MCNLVDDLLHNDLSLEIDGTAFILVLHISRVEIRGAVVNEEDVGVTEVGVHIAVEREDPSSCHRSGNHIKRGSHETTTVLVAFETVSLTEAATSSFQEDQPFG